MPGEGGQPGSDGAWLFDTTDIPFPFPYMLLVDCRHGWMALLGLLVLLEMGFGALVIINAKVVCT